MLHAATNMDRSRRALVAALVCCTGAITLLQGGCSAPRTFPSPSGDHGLSADNPPLPQVITDALKYAHRSVSPDSVLIYNLPVEMNEPAWNAYMRMMGSAKPMCPGDTGVWTVEKARIDGSRAQVDIQYPSRDGFYQRLTVHMTGATAGVGYRCEYVQYWRVPVKDPVCNTPSTVLAKVCGAGAVGAPNSAAVPSAAPAKATAGKTEAPSK
ncbi:MAG: hypothetical protein JNK53_08995 [Phycisphaerae bacterium]|nr:hypothetical protein [Phycisphaerae bacterium]